MILPLIESAHMWATFAVIALAIVLFSMDRIPIELSAIGTVTILVVLFQVFPLTSSDGKHVVDTTTLLAGFANPILFAILSLLIIGQGLFQTGAVEKPAQMISSLSAFGPKLALAGTLIVAGAISAFLNNTPVVVIFIPIIAALATRIGMTAAHVLMPLSFITILGGMTTLIGSSANLVATAVAESFGAPPVGFFDFFVPGVMLASIGGLYVIFVLPRLISPAPGMAERVADHSGKQFIAEVTLGRDHPWLGAESMGGFFPRLENITVRLVQRGERALLPPFDDTILRMGDIVIIAATRDVLAEAVSGGETEIGISGGEARDEDTLKSDGVRRRQLTMAEAVVSPGSRLIGMSIERAHLHADTDCVVLGIERRSRMMRSTMSEIALEAGDVLLMLGEPECVARLGRNRDLLLLARTAVELPLVHHAKRALAVFGLTVAAVASGMVPITVAALTGAVAMVVLGCLTVRQAARAFDRRIYLLVGAAFAMAIPLQATGGAQFIAHGVVSLVGGYGPAALLSALFLLTAIFTNFLSNHATAALFAPIAVSAAREIGADPAPFVYALIFALNCSFATPIAYQTNLMVMGPGHYKFKDFMIAGGPLILLLWLAYSVFAPFYYDL